MGFIRQLFRCLGITSAIALLVPSLAIGSTILTDPAGDVLLGPDIVSVSAGYDSTSLHLRLAFVPGTLDLSNFGLSIGLDTDLNGEILNSGFQGSDYTINLNLWPDQFPLFFGTNGTVEIVYSLCCIGGYPVFGFHDTGITPDLSVPNQVGLIIPLNLLGSDDGIMGFGASAGRFVEIDLGSLTLYGLHIFDHAIGSQGENITTSIPEPNSISLLLFGIAILLLRKVTA